MNRKLDKIKLGGGEKKIAKQHAKGKMTARERINYLIDADKPVFEIGAFAGYNMYKEYGGCPAGGVVIVLYVVILAIICYIKVNIDAFLS